MGEIITREEDLHGYFESGSKPRERWGVGLEYERGGGGGLAFGGEASSRLAEMGCSPKRRYAIRRESLPRRGSLAPAMTNKACGVQIILKYPSVVDAAAKGGTAMGLSPLITALYAH